MPDSHHLVANLFPNICRPFIITPNHFLAFPFDGNEHVLSDPSYWPQAPGRARCLRQDYDVTESLRLIETLTMTSRCVMLTGGDNR